MLAWNLSSKDDQQHAECSKAEFKLCTPVNAVQLTGSLVLTLEISQHSDIH